MLSDPIEQFADCFASQITYFDNKLDVSSIADGFYNFIIQDSGGNIKYTSKILKQKQQ